MTGTTTASTGEVHRSGTGFSLNTEKASPKEDDQCSSFASSDDGLDDSGAKVMAKLRPARGVTTTVNVVWNDVEEPQAEPAPRNQRPQSGVAGRALRCCERRDREVERVRRLMCDGSAGSSGPIPTWVMDQLEEQRAPRAAGGRHTKADAKTGTGPQPLKRVASAGRLRGAFTEASLTPGNAASGILSGVLADKAPVARPSTATGLRSSTSTATGLPSNQAT